MARTLDGFNKLRKNSNLVSIMKRVATGENVYETKGTCESPCVSVTFVRMSVCRVQNQHQKHLLDRLLHGHLQRERGWPSTSTRHQPHREARDADGSPPPGLCSSS